MRSTFGGLNTVGRGLYVQQASLDTVGHNIANANTDGYSRQNVNLATTRPQGMYGMNGENQIGTGVNVESITRARDTFIDRQMWKEKSSLGYGQTAVDTLARVEDVFHEPSENGVQSTMNKFWTSLQTLATNASDEGTRTTVRQRGVELTDAIGHATTQLTDMVADTNSVIDIKVGRVNQISSEVASLNHQIMTIESGGMDHANDLRDRRDVLVDELSKLAGIHATEDKQGNFNIQLSGIPIVNPDGFHKLVTVSAADPDYGYEIKQVMEQGGTEPIKFTNGELRGLLEMRDSMSANNSYDGIKGYIKKLDKISEFLLKEFNDVHKTGLGTDNVTGHNFFGDDTTSYTQFSPKKNTMGWISELKVNPALFNTANGLGLIAAKTPINNLAIEQSNAAGGAAVIDSTYTGNKPLYYQVRLGGTTPAIGDVATNGKINAVSVSTDNGVTWQSVTAKTPETDPRTFVLPMPKGTISSEAVTIQVNTESHNVVGDVYAFTVNQGNASGDNAIKLANVLKVPPLNSATTLEGASLDSYYNSIIGALGVQSQSAKSLTDNQKVLVGQITNWRESVSGINVDEEMSNMIRFQKGYAAAARVLTTMDEMLDKLINSTGTVGR